MLQKLYVIVVIVATFNQAAADCLVIAHRGASGYLPEHTLGAYRLAMEMGADYVEPDLVLTKDGIPVARHESRLDLTTDIASKPEYAARRRTVEIRGEDVNAWFVEDFTLGELRQLKARERFGDLRPASANKNNLFRVPTLQDVIDLVTIYEDQTGREIGIYPEIKGSPTDDRSVQDRVRIVVDVLASNEISSTSDDVIIQSFDSAALRRARDITELRLVQLLWAEDDAEIAEVTAPDALATIAGYADGIGVPKYGFVLSRSLPRQSTGLVESAQAQGLFVHVYTFRAENYFLPAEFRLGENERESGDLAGELNAFLAVGIDGFFVDQPDIGRDVCDQR